MRRACLVLAAASLACAGGAGNAGPDGPSCPDYRYESQFSYEVSPAFTTPEGIAVDASGQEVSAESVDRLTDDVEACLVREFGSPPAIILSSRFAWSIKRARSASAACSAQSRAA